jgi:hypothetical protein
VETEVVVAWDTVSGAAMKTSASSNRAARPGRITMLPYSPRERGSFVQKALYEMSDSQLTSIARLDERLGVLKERL